MTDDVKGTFVIQVEGGRLWGPFNNAQAAAAWALQELLPLMTKPWSVIYVYPPVDFEEGGK